MNKLAISVAVVVMMLGGVGYKLYHRQLTFTHIETLPTEILSDVEIENPEPENIVTSKDILDNTDLPSVDLSRCIMKTPIESVGAAYQLVHECPANAVSDFVYVIRNTGSDETCTVSHSDEIFSFEGAGVRKILKRDTLVVKTYAQPSDGTLHYGEVLSIGTSLSDDQWIYVRMGYALQRSTGNFENKIVGETMFADSDHKGYLCANWIQ